ncbi:hypothetical protein C6497_02365 [Candidatus Poribacteria bacterium]|nr:MAG: hypothetical protein C6497_02365 [Candidatus Poribacteria bacterium]
MKNLRSNNQHKYQRIDSFTRRDFLSTGFKVGAATFTTGLLPYLSLGAAEKYNVLFIVVDDLRPMLRCYGVPEMKTPNIDKLAARGTQFNRAYCQYPLCNPSRASILTGLRPETTKVNNNSLDYKHTIPDAVDIYQHFMNNGYQTYTIGKVKHYPNPSSGGPSWKALDVSDDDLTDGMTARETVDLLSEIKDQTFFLAVGLDKPHLPFNAPVKYFDLYNPNPFSLPTTMNYPSNSPSFAENNLDTFGRFFSDIPSGDTQISQDKTLELIQAYAASTSYMDAQVGRIMTQLDTLGLSENTVIVFCGDHGFHLGEHGTWRKNTLYEISVRSPMIICVPGQMPCQTNSLSELVDIYPTLCDLCNIPILSELEGVSLKSVIEDPTISVKSAAFSNLTRAGAKSGSIRTNRYRYTEWGRIGKFGRELYDYHTDPHETVNIVDLPENAEIVEELSERLHTGWKEAISNTIEHSPILHLLPWDVNNDGIVDFEDLRIVSDSFGSDTPVPVKNDVNKDGRVDILDLLLIASHLGESCYSSAPKSNASISHQHSDTVLQWLLKAYQLDDGSDIFRDGIANLENLINIQRPPNTTLLPNYPNPFNPETWIPYDLSQDSMVKIQIYNQKGQSVRILDLGFQNAGTYRTKHQAAFWDGRNSYGELVASGTYYYSLTAREYNSIRKMVIQK